METLPLKETALQKTEDIKLQFKSKSEINEQINNTSHQPDRKFETCILNEVSNDIGLGRIKKERHFNAGPANITKHYTGARSTNSPEDTKLVSGNTSYSPSLIDKEEFCILGQSKMVNTDAQNTPNQEVVTVKFLLDSSETFASAFKITSNIQEVKERLADVLNLSTDLIKLEKDGFDVDNWLPLAGLGVEPFGSLELKLTSTEPGKSIIVASVSEYIPTVDVITVHVWQDEGQYKDIIVEIENQCCKKDWLGGYRNRITKVEYHHALSQTMPKFRKVFDYSEPGVVVPLLFHRDTQTPLPPRNIPVDTVVNKATQMWRTDHYIPSKDDKIMVAKNFLSYAEWLDRNNVEEKVIKIQRAVREWLHQRNVQKLVDLQKYILRDVKEQKLAMFQEQAEKKRQIIAGAAFPSKRDDFYMLYLMVGKWWQKEWQRICDLRTEEPKKAEFVALLEKEIKLLSAIEKHRIEVKQESLKKQQVRFLEVSSRPIIFRNTKGIMTSIDNPATQRAREFKEIYSTLIRKDTIPKERVDFLITLKHLMCNYNAYEYTKDIITLIDREIDLLVIGIKDADLEGLRKRIEQLYIDFLHQPQFNPKASQYRKANWPKTIDTLYKCTRCLKLLPASGYPVHTRMAAYTVCKSCDWLQNIGHQRIDMSPYLKILRQVQNSEMQQCCYSSLCFVLQQIGMYFLTNIIWHGHSAISECRDLSKLQMVRWLRDIEWSPWNTILLTEQEAKCHMSISDVFQFYDKSFIESARQKHILSRIHFIPLLKTDHHLRSSGAWQNITDSGPYIHPSHINAFALETDFDRI